jgi:cobalt/nickel transport system permease protein
LIKGMEKLGIPKIFTVLTSFMYRYSFILIGEMYRMKRARDSRCFGRRWYWQTKIIPKNQSILLRIAYRNQ